MNEEPATSNLLQKQLTSIECRSLFLKSSSQGIQAEIVKHKERLMILEAIPIEKKRNIDVNNFRIHLQTLSDAI